MDQWSFTAPFEGIIPHIYLDSEGLPTCGVGFLIATEAACAKLPWLPSRQAALADYQQVKSQPKGFAAGHYRAFCKAHLSEDVMRPIFNDKVVAFRKELQRTGWQLERLPDAAQIAVVDLAYNMGVARLNKGFVNFRAAINARDWVRAAAECRRRKPVSDERNEATRKLLLSAAAA